MEINELFVCGYNAFGQLGIFNNSFNFTTQNAWEKNNFLQENTYYDTKIKTIICGTNATFLILENHFVFACGSNTNYEIGISNYKNEHVKKFELINTNNFIKEGNVKELILLKNFKDVKSIYCGMFFSVMLNNKGEVYGCGDNEDLKVNLLLIIIVI